MNRHNWNRFAVLFSMQQSMGMKLHVAKNQTPTAKNGGRPTFKQNRRQQLKGR